MPEPNISDVYSVVHTPEGNARSDTSHYVEIHGDVLTLYCTIRRYPFDALPTGCTLHLGDTTVDLGIDYGLEGMRKGDSVTLVHRVTVKELVRASA